MSNSSMVVYTKISPNKTSPRNMAIDRITPHCVVGQLSCESICGCFTKTSVKASCNYGIGTDGRVSLCVEEKDRSWCSSSAANDNRAITIECASDMSEPYTMNEKVYATLIELCADICRRNGKTKVLWFGDKTTTLNYQPKSNEMVFTVHRWFKNKSCPGNWLYNRMGDLAQKVNAKLSGSSVDNSVDNSVDKSNETIIWDFLRGKGLNEYAVAGLMGNLYAESGLRPNNLQNSFEQRLGLDDAEYTKAVDNGTYTNFVKDSAGYGLAQWTYYTRKQNLLNFATKSNKSIGDLDMQLNFLWNELVGYPTLINILKTATDVPTASNAVLFQFERPADMSEKVQKQRAAYGQAIYDRHHSNSSNTVGFTPYTVRVTANALNIREKPTTDSAIVGSIKDKGIYTIVEESSGKGATKWGKLKSGIGWISLDYVRRT